MSTFTRTTIRTLSNDINNALAEVAAKYGVTIKTGSCTFADDYCTFKLEVAKVSENGNAMTKQAADYLAYAPLRGWDPGRLFQTVMLAVGPCTVIGAYPRRKQPIIVQAANGARYTTSDYVVKPNTPAIPQAAG